MAQTELVFGAFSNGNAELVTWKNSQLETSAEECAEITAFLFSTLTIVEIFSILQLAKIETKMRTK